MTIKIISFSRLGHHGRLGNQLFQVASTLGLAEHYGAEALFPKWHYADYFENEIQIGETFPSNLIQERKLCYHDWDLQGDSDLLGYLQSEKYFGSKHVQFKQSFVEKCKNRLPIFDRGTICIQVRRGDYVGNSNYYQCTPNYFIDALLTHFPHWRDCNILIVSDDLEYCRVHFEAMPNAHFADGFSDIESMALASACDHFIISNSSFGWWCAWLGEKENTKIIHPGRLYAGRLANQESNDYYPSRWISHKKDDYKIDLRDMTFTIPVRFDHQARKENVDLILYFLMASFHTNIIIGEQGGNVFEYTRQWATYINFDLSEFHRTKMLNQMCERAETPFVANYDCDVILPTMQILMAVLELRDGADFVYPYDGRFARMGRGEWFEKIQASRDIGMVGNTPFKGREQGHFSIGGCIFYNVDSFVDAGMENEYFISFGPEDVERYERFKMLGYDIRRTRGVLFHMNHWVGPDSSPRNPLFQANQEAYRIVHEMTNATQLREYVNGWPWRHPYTDQYYEHISEGSIRSAKIVMESLSFHPESIIDVGCGVGEWNNGHPNYWGLDHRINPDKLLFPKDHYIDLDLNKAFWNNEPNHFDLCICLEVAEHLRPERAETLVSFLCSLSDRVLFSAAIPHQGGRGHVNEQFQSYWADLFKRNGYGAAKTQPDIRNCADVELWYRQNIVLYERGASGIVRNFVLPEYYLQIAGHLAGI